MKFTSDRNKSLLLAFTGMALAALTNSVKAQIIYSDNFDTGASHASIAGRSPQTDLPGQTWSVSRNFSTGAGEFYAWTNTPGFTTGPNQATSLFLWNGSSGNAGSGAATLPLASTGSYTKPTEIKLSADLQTVDLASSGAQGMLLGFYSAAPTDAQDPLTGFSGFLVTKAGSLTLVQNGVEGSAVAYSGTSAYDNTAFNTLSLTINTGTGALTSVSFGSDTSYTFSSTAFTSTATAYAGVGIESIGDNDFGYADNFTVSGVPEPSTCALLAGGLGTLLVCRFRRKMDRV